MKKNIKIILFSCFIGTILACLFFLNIKEKAEAKTSDTLYVFQVGVFKQEQNAINLQKDFKYSRIIKDKDYYRVFLGCTIRHKEKLKKYFNNQGYNYFLKEMKVKEEILSIVGKYDELLNETSEENIELIIKSSLEGLPNEL